MHFYFYLQIILAPDYSLLDLNKQKIKRIFHILYMKIIQTLLNVQ